jgi:hypothetical protein
MNDIAGMKSVLRKLIFESCSYFNNKDPEKNIIIVADPRAGSTWLSEIMLRQSQSALIWEPLHIGENSLFKDIGFSYRQHIPQRIEWPEAKKAFKQVLAGKNLNAWTTKFTTIPKILSADRLLIKFCRAGLLLPWLVENFQFERKPVYMIRHPFAVVASQLKKGSWDQVPTSYVLTRGRFNHLVETHLDFLKRLKSRAEVLLCTWCITNGYLLSHPGNNDHWVTITYEELLLNPEETLSRIYRDHWGLDLPVQVLNGISTPSKTALDGVIKPVDQQLRGWRDYFTKEQIDRFQQILDHFNISLYNQSYLPVTSACTL